MRQIVEVEIGGRTYEMSPGFKTCAKIESRLNFGLLAFFSKVYDESGSVNMTLQERFDIFDCAIVGDVDREAIEEFVFSEYEESTLKALEFLTACLSVPEGIKSEKGAKKK